MRRRRSLLLLEVLVGLALLALLGVGLLHAQRSALRQHHEAELKRRAAALTERLLWDWSVSRTAVTLPTDGRFDETLTWQRRAVPVRVGDGVFATQVSLSVEYTTANAPPREVYRVDWWVAEPRRIPLHRGEP